ncbi:hypothetical protein SAMN02910317_00133 [Ruminococcaceae bacterium FB2012]|nr:hypothetical protein SAMN02910317_00133 [Ruminococcaceae bacterium FB2012]
MLHVSGASEGVRVRPESPRERFTPTEGSAANQICGPNYVSCGGIAPSALGPTGKPPRTVYANGELRRKSNLRPELCFLRVQENTFSGAAYGLSTPKMRSDGFCALLLSSAAPGSSLRAEWDSVPIFPSLTRENCPCWGAAPVPARALPLTRQGYRALDCGMRFAFGSLLCALSLQTVLRYIIIILFFPPFVKGIRKTGSVWLKRQKQRQYFVQYINCY